MSIRRRAHQNQDTLPLIRFIFQAKVDMDSIHPKVNVGFLRELALGPIIDFLRPCFLQTHDRIRAQSLDRFSHEPRKRLEEISRGNALEVQERQQFIDRL